MLLKFSVNAHRLFPLKDIKVITNAFQKILNESNCKPKTIWVD